MYPKFTKMCVSESDLNSSVIELNKSLAADFIKYIKESDDIKKTKILAWAHKLALMIDSGELNKPKSRISAIISNELLSQGQTEGVTAWVRQALSDYPDFKDSRYNRYTNRNEISDGDIANLDTVFDDVEDLAKSNLSDNDLVNMSPAQRNDVIAKTEDKIREFKRRLVQKSHIIQDQKERFNIKTTEDKVSSEDPPEEFQGMNAFTDMCNRLAERYRNIGEHFEELGIEAQKFKPDEKTANTSVAYLTEWLKRQEPFETLVTINLKYIRNVLNPIKDKKFATDYEGWFKLAWDDIVNYGAHGSGRKNAQKTGETYIRIGKDGIAEIYEVGRETTREQVGDRTAGTILQQAYNNAQNDFLQKSIRNWYENATFIENVGSLDDFIANEKKRNMLSR